MPHKAANIGVMKLQAQTPDGPPEVQEETTKWNGVFIRSLCLAVLRARLEEAVDLRLVWLT